MKIPVNVSSRSASVKVAVIGFLTLVLLIPLGMIKGIIVDRQGNASIATLDIRNSWGGDQTVVGPILGLPYKVEMQTVYGSAYSEEKVVYLLAEELSVSADVVAEERYRGLHKVPVFSADIGITGAFRLGALSSLGIESDQVDWSGAKIFLGVSDLKAIRKVPVVVANNTSVNFTTSGGGIDGVPSRLSADLDQLLNTTLSEMDLLFDISVALNGSGLLQFLPLAENAEVTMSANWHSPSFSGRRLPATREIRDDGFDASWHASSLGRKLSAVWIGDQAVRVDTAEDAFGARFIQPIGLYQLVLRATKYGVLFVGLTFVSYFLIEVIGSLALHPLQYLLVGFANTLFYMLLLSLAEHVGFDIAYGISAAASVVLISGYSASILLRRSRAALMAAVLTALYAFLYLTLKAESFALLAGSIGLWIVLATVMYLTRGINWYAAGASDQKQTTFD